MKVRFSQLPAPRRFAIGILFSASWMLNACAPSAPRIGPNQLAAAPAIAPSITPEAHAANDTAAAIAPPLADAQHQAESLPTTTPQRAPLILDLSKISDAMNNLANALQNIVDASAKVDAANAQMQAWVKQAQETDAKRLAFEADQAKQIKDLQDSINSKTQNALWWLVVVIALAGAVGAAAMIVYMHNVPGGVTLAVCAGAAIFVLRMLALIDYYKIQILIALACIGVAYELYWILWYRFVQKMTWGDAIHTGLMTWNVPTVASVRAQLAGVVGDIPPQAVASSGNGGAAAPAAKDGAG